MDMPGYWMHETSGVLRPAVEAYLLGNLPLAEPHVAALRAYLRQWMAGPWGPEAEIGALRTSIDSLNSREAFEDWFADALKLGIDPL